MASEVAAKRIQDKPDAAPAPLPAGEVPLFAPLRDLDKRGKLVIAGLILLANIPLIHYFFRHVLRAMPTTTTVPFVDSFDRADVGPNYWSTGGDWRVENGELHEPGVRGNPLWVQAALPDDVAIDFRVRATNNEGELEWELFGDGLNHGSGYTFVFGGFRNQVTALAKFDEQHSPVFDPRLVGMQGPPNDPDQNAVANRKLGELYANHTFDAGSAWRVQRTDVRVQGGVPYQVHIERRGGDIKWYINSQLVMDVVDPMPLKGKGHDRFGLSGAIGVGGNEGDAFYDDLSIQPLK